MSLALPMMPVTISPVLMLVEQMGEKPRSTGPKDENLHGPI